MAGNVIERILRMRDEASPALRGVADQARTTAAAVDSVDVATSKAATTAGTSAESWKKLAAGLGYGGVAGDVEDLTAAMSGANAGAVAMAGGFAIGATAAIGLETALYALGQAGVASLASLESLGRLDLVSAEQIASVREIDRAMKDLGVQWDRMIVALTDRFAPAIQLVVNGLSGWVQLAGYLAGSPVGGGAAPAGGIASLGGAGLLQSTTQASRMQMTAADWEGLATPAPTRSTGGRSSASAPIDYTGMGLGNAATVGGGSAAATSAGVAAQQQAIAAREAAGQLLAMARAAQVAGMAAEYAAQSSARVAWANELQARAAAMAGRIAGGIETGTAALTGGIEGVASVASAAGPYGQAIAAAMRAMEAIRNDPQSVANTVKAVMTLLPDFLAALPEAIGAAVPAIIEGFVLGFPRIVSGVVGLIPRIAGELARSLVGLPKIIADGIRAWWKDIVAELRAMFRVGGGRNRDDRPERERGRGPASMPGRQDRDEARRQRVTLGSLGLGLSTARGV